MRNIYVLLFLFLCSQLHAQEVTTAQVTNLGYAPIPQYELPKRYLIDGYSTLYPKENPYRRADIVFFLSLPITMFIVQNIINFINIANLALGNYNSNLVRDNYGFTMGEWSFVIAALIGIPTGIMIYDAVYVNTYPFNPFFKQEGFKEARVDFNVYRFKF